MPTLNDLAPLNWDALATYLPRGTLSDLTYAARPAATQAPQYQDWTPPPTFTTAPSAGGGLASDANNASMFGGSGIAGGIGSNAGGVDSMYGFQFPNNGSMDGKEFQFLNNYQLRPSYDLPDVYTPPPMFGDGLTSTFPLAPRDIKANALTQSDLDRLKTLPELAPYFGEAALGYGDYSTRVDPSYYTSGLPSPAQFADANGVINTRPSWQAPSFFDDPFGNLSTKLGRVTNTPDSFTFGNGVQAAINTLAPPGISQVLSGLLGYAGVGTNNTGNPVLNSIAQPAFGIGTNNIYPDANSGLYSDPGATAWAGYDLSPAMQSANEAYSKGSRYDTTGKGWVADPSRDYVPQPLQPYNIQPSPLTESQLSSLGQLPELPSDPYSLTGNMLDTFMLGAGFGAGRFDNVSNPYSNLWNGGGSFASGDSMDLPMFGPGARFSSDRFSTD